LLLIVSVSYRCPGRRAGPRCHRCAMRDTAGRKAAGLQCNNTGGPGTT